VKVSSHIHAPDGRVDTELLEAEGPSLVNLPIINSEPVIDSLLRCSEYGSSDFHAASGQSKPLHHESDLNDITGFRQTDFSDKIMRLESDLKALRTEQWGLAQKILVREQYSILS